MTVDLKKYWYQRSEEISQKMTLMSDLFMRNVLRDRQCVEHVLRVLLKDDTIKIRTVLTQEDMCNLWGRSLWPDILAIDQNGVVYNLEVQNDPAGAIPERARYHGSMIDTKILLPGEEFTDLRKLYVIFIVNGDVFGGGCQIYTVQKNIKQMGIAFRDKFDIMWLDTNHQDETDIGRLCHDFTVSNPEDVYDEVLREKMKALKVIREGGSVMCRMVDDLLHEVEETTRLIEHEKAFAEGHTEGRTEEKLEMVRKLRQEGLSDELIARVSSSSVEQVREWCR